MTTRSGQPGDGGPREATHTAVRAREARVGARRAVALASLTLGGFAIGCSEFVAMGVLPEVAQEAMPAVYASSSSDAAAATSVFVWGYALGVVIGAPLLGPLSARFERGRFVVGALLVMCIATAATALVPSFTAVIVARVLSGLPHAAFFGVGAIVAASLLGAQHAARGVAVVIGGLAIANVVGVPLGAWLGQAVGWRVGYVAIAVLFAIAAIGAGWALRGAPRPSLIPRLGASFRGLINTRLWLIVLVYALVNAGLFAVLTFSAPIATGLAGMASGLVPLALAAMGIGMTLGTYSGGALADRSRRLAVTTAVISAATGFGALLIAESSPLWFSVGIFLVGFTMGCVTPFVQVTLMRVSSDHPQVGSSMNSLCANAGSVLGGVCASTAIHLAAGVGAAIWVGIALTGMGFVAAAALRGYLGVGAGESHGAS